MSEPVKTRPYRSPVRAAMAARTRSAIIDAARDLLVSEGFTRTTVNQVAERAQVNVDTIYRVVGTKTALVRAVVESALSGGPEAIPAQQREYVHRVRAATSARDKIRIYADAIVEIQQRLAPIFVALKESAGADARSRSLWQEIADRRARNMLEFAADLRETGEVRTDLDDQDVADIIWSMNSPEYWILLVHERHWSPGRFRDGICDAWTRLLLANP